MALLKRLVPTQMLLRSTLRRHQQRQFGLLSWAISHQWHHLGHYRLYLQDQQIQRLTMSRQAQCRRGTLFLPIHWRKEDLRKRHPVLIVSTVSILSVAVGPMHSMAIWLHHARSRTFQDLLILLASSPLFPPPSSSIPRDHPPRGLCFTLRLRTCSLIPMPQQGSTRTGPSAQRYSRSTPREGAPFRRASISCSATWTPIADLLPLDRTCPS